MRAVHAVLAGIAVVVSGIALGSGVSGYAVSPANGDCFNFVILEQTPRVTGDSSYSWAPFGTDCEPADATGKPILLGPSVPAWIAWMVAMTALVGWAVRRPGGRAAAGALAAAGLLTICGVASHNGSDFNFTMMAGMFWGPPVVLLTRHLWLARGERDWLRSFGVTVVLGPVVFVVATFFTFFGNALGHLGCALGIAAGAAVSAVAHRVPPYVEAHSTAV